MTAIALMPECSGNRNNSRLEELSNELNVVLSAFRRNRLEIGRLLSEAHELLAERREWLRFLAKHAIPKTTAYDCMHGYKQTLVSDDGDDADTEAVKVGTLRPRGKSQDNAGRKSIWGKASRLGEGARTVVEARLGGLTAIVNAHGTVGKASLHLLGAMQRGTRLERALRWIRVAYRSVEPIARKSELLELADKIKALAVNSSTLEVDGTREVVRVARPRFGWLIYKPQGRAREYAELALNPYSGCAR